MNAEPEAEELSWAEVYRVNDCGGCGKPGCGRCVNRFLAYLRANGTPPQQGGAQ